MIDSSDKVYLRTLRDVMINGNLRKTRNAETLSKFGVSMEFDISHSFPLLTTKRMAWKSIVAELLWFIKGRTNSKELEEQGVNIWKGNSSREFLDNIGLTDYPEGECGPIYGFQWRNFNGDGIDQLGNIIDQLNMDPTSRRMFMSAWNPSQMSKMCLPPCHVSYQFYVEEGDRLSCILTQRSADMFLGSPFNIASSALLVYILAFITKKKPHRLIINIGDAHIYTSHLPQVMMQLEREPFVSPTLSIVDFDDHMSIDDIETRHIKLENYTSHSQIIALMIP
jgi:thymidylate synthase